MVLVAPSLDVQHYGERTKDLSGETSKSRSLASVLHARHGNEPGGYVYIIVGYRKQINQYPSCILILFTDIWVLKSYCGSWCDWDEILDQ